MQAQVPARQAGRWASWLGGRRQLAAGRQPLASHPGGVLLRPSTLLFIGGGDYSTLAGICGKSALTIFRCALHASGPPGLLLMLVAFSAAEELLFMLRLAVTPGQVR